MDPLLRATLFKTALPAAAILVVLAVAAKRGISRSDDLGFRRPRPAVLAAWLAIWLVWIAASELLIRQFGLEQATPWPAYPVHIVVVRILAIGILGPCAEEIVMRGIVLFQIRRRLGNVHAAIVIVALLWAAMHSAYGPGTVALIIADGTLFGYARHRGESLWIPIAMHTVGNLISIGQSLTG
jgi:membrane protease YdiL (CAAX protease family)